MSTNYPLQRFLITWHGKITGGKFLAAIEIYSQCLLPGQATNITDIVEFGFFQATLLTLNSLVSPPL